ncbi:hypothetical protein PCASD_22334 [Puccinia coronata f. sp. avenae]|uniref:Uncharacterized protein n=1 Tax=Puccinia coronata f. sp. avenae TaxID=200324 RepID=A0A2N5U8D2_9BASI|nr:hypothetical protein PCASD_22334 [Puccinia coronata f. sp. avenae]
MDTCYPNQKKGLLDTFELYTGKVIFTLPVSADDICGFCFWAGRDKGKTTKKEILAKTIEKYLQEIKAWHLLHGKKYPDLVEPTVKVLLRSSAKADALVPFKEKKGAIHVRHLICFTECLEVSDPKDEAIFDLAIVAFWGMARLGELTSPLAKGELNIPTLVFAADVSWEGTGENSVAVLTLHDART